MSKVEMSNLIVELNGTQFYCEAAGDGFPLVLVHAGIADGRMWDDQFEAFAQNYRVVRYDRRGFGQNSDDGGKLFAPQGSV